MYYHVDQIYSDPHQDYLKQETEAGPAEAGQAEAVQKPAGNDIWQLGVLQDNRVDPAQLPRTCSHLKGPTQGNLTTQQKPQQKTAPLDATKFANENEQQ